MKPTTVLPILLLCVLLAAISLVKIEGQQLKYCRETLPSRVEACGSDGKTKCLLDFLGAYGASKMPKNCICTDVPPANRSCSCEIVCGPSATATAKLPITN